MTDSIPQLVGAKLDTILAILAILFATIQFWDSLHLKRKMRSVLANEKTLIDRTEAVTKQIEGVSQSLIARIEAVTKQIEDVGRSLSSRYIGTFPKNLKQIAEVVDRADRFVLILTDWVGYAMYSAPQEYEDYKRHLRDLCLRPEKAVPVYIVAYDEACAKEQFADQFPEKDFGVEKLKPRFKRFFERYRHAKPEPSNYGEFAAEMFAIEREQRAELKNLGAQIQELHERSLVLLWLEDGEEAVFCFQTHGGNERGLSFRTRDIGLLTSLRDLVRARWTGDLPALPHEHADFGGTPKATRP